MSVSYKDISQLSQKSSIAGTEKIPVSDTEYVTPNQIASLGGGGTGPATYTVSDIEDISGEVLDAVGVGDIVKEVNTSNSEDKCYVVNYIGYDHTSISLFSTESYMAMTVDYYYSDGSWETAGVSYHNLNLSSNIYSDKDDDSIAPTTQATYGEIHPAYATSIPNGGMLPNILYKLGTKTGSVSMALANAWDNTIENEYKFTFDTSSTPPTITWSNKIYIWLGNCLSSNVPVIAANKHYEVSVLDGYAYIIESSILES